jgi:hypothetical protein
MPTCVWQRYDSKYRLERDLRSNTKIKQGLINNSYQNENRSKIKIPYEHMIGDQVLLETL